MKILTCVAAVLMAICVPAAFAGESIYEAALKAPGRLESDLKRDETSKPDEIMAFFDIQTGMKIADLFAGGGYYSELLASVVGEEGLVVSHNNQAYIPFVKEELEARYTEGRLPNVKRLLKEAEQMELGESQFDAVFLVMAYHDLFFKDQGWDIDAEKFMSQIKAALKPGGKLCVIDHIAKDGSGTDDAKTLHRIDPAFAKSEIEKAGFKFMRSTDVLKNTEDDHSKSVFDKDMRRRSDRFVFLFEKKS